VHVALSYDQLRRALNAKRYDTISYFYVPSKADGRQLYRMETKMKTEKIRKTNKTTTHQEMR